MALARRSPELAAHLARAGRAAIRQAQDAEAFYRRFHWGRRGESGAREVRAPVVVAGEPLVELGTLREVAYQTRKGAESGSSIYVHEFEARRPTLAYSMLTKALVIVGGEYRVTWSGIVG